MTKDRTERLMKMLVAGRTLDEQTEYVRRYGGHGVIPILRRMLIDGLGIAHPKPTAENVVIFGCYIPFTEPMLICDYLRLLDVLGTDYSYLEKEFCCGSPLRDSAGPNERDQALRVSREFMQLNRDSALQKGAKNIVYCCSGCAHTAKSFFPAEADHHMYYFELLFDKIEQRTLKIAPTTMGYFEGCKTRYRKQYPGAEIDWKRCRNLLDRIEGLRIVDLPNNLCCSAKPEGIVQAAQQHGLDTILCSCNSCYGSLKAAAQGKVEVKFLTELLLEAVEAK